MFLVMYSNKDAIVVVTSKDGLLGTSWCRDIAFLVILTMIDLFERALEHWRIKRLASQIYSNSGHETLTLRRFSNHLANRFLLKKHR